MPMKRYISDQHFYDADVMRDLDHRPFHNAEEMNEYMILQWNDTVKNDDEIYIIGDMFSWSGTGRDPVKCGSEPAEGKDLPDHWQSRLKVV